MAQYIDKSALVAEIERRMKLRQDGYRKYNDVNDFVAFEELEYLHDEFLPTLEVKEVDLEKHLKEEIEAYFDLGVVVKGATYFLSVDDIKEVAEHFFELGLKSTERRINL